MPRVQYLQTTFNSGVLDPRLAARLELRQYYQGLSRGTNILIRPMGGVRRRPGTRYLATLAQEVESIEAVASATAPNGGDPLAAKDTDRTVLLETTTNVGTVNPYVAVQYDLGEPRTVRFADALDLTVTGGNTDEFRIQYSGDGVTWSNFGDAFLRVDQELRDYRREGPVTARYWRVAKVGGSDLGAETASLGGFRLWSETGQVADGRIMAFEFSVAQRYAVVAGDKNLAIVQDDKIVANVPAPWSYGDLAELDHAQSADTMILVHPDYAPQRLVRGDASSLWRLEPVPFTSYPQVDFNDASSPEPVSEVQEISFEGATWEQGNTFVIEIRGATTRSITYAGAATAEEQATTAENMRREIQKIGVLPATGVVVEFVSYTAGPPDVAVFRVSFTEASADSYELIGVIPEQVPSSAKAVVSRTAAGSSRKENAWSATRGWPSSITFHEGRLWFGGSRSLPQTVFASQIGDLFGYTIGEGFDDDAIVQTLNSDRLNAIQAIFSGRELHLFTTGGEATYGSDVLTPENAYPKFQTRFGSGEVRPVSIDGSTLFVQRTGKVLREFVFDLNEDAYLSPPLTAVSPSIVNAIRDMAAWQGSGDDDANYVFVVNGDGTVAVFNTLRAQEVASWVEWTTRGEFKAVETVLEDIYFLVKRTIDGADRLMLERVDESLLTDCAKTGSTVDALAGPFFFPAVQTDLAHLEGAEVDALADGYYLGRAAVAGGELVVPELEDLLEAEIGLPFAVDCATMPLNSEFGNGANFLRKKRLVHARLYVYQTGGVVFNGRRYYDRQFDEDTFDSPAPLHTGMIEIPTSSDWVNGPLVITFGQDVPAPFELLGMDLQVETE